MSSRARLDVSIILQAATRLIDENGFDQLSWGKLAKELKVRPPSLYNHVDGLNDLKQKLAVHGVKEQHQLMIQAAVGCSGDDAVRALGKAYIQFVRMHPGLYEATFRAPLAKDPKLLQAKEDTLQLVAKVFAAYGLKDDLAIHMIRGFRSLLHGFTSIQQKGGFGLPVEVDQSFSILMDTFLLGMRTMIEKSSADEHIPFPDQ